MRWTIPNTLTFMRLVAALAVVVAFVLLPRPYADWVIVVLFVLAAITDFFDGYLARRWQQTSNFGKMLDPIADKAMTIIALVLLVTLVGGATLFIIPATIIVFREVFISGLREFLGASAGSLPVTKMAKWKTSVQMTAIAVLFSQGLFEHYVADLTSGMGIPFAQQVLAGVEEDVYGLRWRYSGYIYSYWIGLSLFWVAALLTVVTGIDYYIKARPFFRDGEDE